MVVQGDVDEVEQVAVVAAGRAARADRAGLHRVAGRRVAGHPGLATVVGRVDVEVPDAVEVRVVLVVATGRCAEVGDRARSSSPATTVGNTAFLMPNDGADRLPVGPGLALVAARPPCRACRPRRRSRSRRCRWADAHGRVGVTGRGAGHVGDRPGGAVVGGDDRGLVRAAALVGEVGGAVGSDLDVPVQTAAVEQAVRRDAGAERGAAVTGDRAEGGRDVLAAVVDGVRVGRGGQGAEAVGENGPPPRVWWSTPAGMPPPVLGDQVAPSSSV